jgi:hypothetical protein
MTVRVYRSTDRGAPRLAGTTGDLTTWLDAVLVDGYGSQTVTLSRSGSTVTVTDTAHGLAKGARRLISGADQTEYNGEFVVEVVDADTYTYQITTTPDTPATGTITAITPPAGWTIPFTDTNVRVIRPPAGNRYYLRVADTGAGSAIYARVRGYTAMTSSADAGTDPFPTNTQVSGGLYIHKSSVTGTAARAWVAIVADTYMYIHIAHAGGGQYATHFFGDFDTPHGSYIYNTALIATASTTTTITTNTFDRIATSSPTALAGHYVARTYTNTGTSLAVTKLGTGYVLSGSGIGSFGDAYPSIPTNTFNVYQLEFANTSATDSQRLGTLPGVLGPYHGNAPIQVGDTFDGTGPYTGKLFLMQALAGSLARAIFVISESS